MKTLTLARPLILIVIGLPGAGKSFFARQFADMFSAPLVNYDKTRATLFAQPAYSASEQSMLHSLLLYQAQEIAKTKRSFIIDGGCNTRPERQIIERLAKKHGYETLAIWVQTDNMSSRQRATHKKPKQSPDDILPNLTVTQWEDMSKKFQPPTKEPYMVISGKHAFSTQAKMVLRKLAAPRVAEAQNTHLSEKSKRLAPAPTRTLTKRPQAKPTPRKRSVVIS